MTKCPLTKKFLNSLTYNECAYLLYISVCGLPHVVVLYDTSQRLPWQLHKTKRMKKCGRRGGKRQRGN